MDLFTDEKTVAKGEVYHKYRKELYEYLDKQGFYLVGNTTSYYTKDYRYADTEAYFGHIAVFVNDTEHYESTPNGMVKNGDGSISVYMIEVYHNTFQQKYNQWEEYIDFDIDKAIDTLKVIAEDFKEIKSFINDWTKRQEEERNKNTGE